MSLPGPRFTYEDYLLLPEDKRYELIEGELLVTPAPATRHQRILLKLAVRLSVYSEANGLGQVLPAPCDVILSSENVVQPDVLYVVRQRLSIINPAGGVHGAPDLVVEILSPSTASRDQVFKRKLYGKYGVREYWVVDPAASTIEVLVLGASGLETSRVFPIGSAVVSLLLPDLLLTVDDVFAE
ncbi:MAG TPA: Uma2 family endonuclease [Symbiobacteriaceae bacterium]|nr:Uma2 family endonuclease [Symbiobacteriaceae bacterium]